MTRIPRVSRGERERENRDGVNRAYANPVEALQASGTCRTLLILNTCSLVLAGSTPTRGEWSLYGIPLPLSPSLSPHPAHLSIRGHFSPERNRDCETGLVAHIEPYVPHFERAIFDRLSFRFDDF